jgi:hypothetical protein
VATSRIPWGGAGFSARQVDQYQLAPFLEVIPIVGFIPEPEALRGMGLRTGPGELPRCVERILEC